MTTLAQVHAMLPGSQLLNMTAESAKTIAVSRISTDSRQVNLGELFIALTGERFDAHQFLNAVSKAGAVAALISNPEKCPVNLAAICVPDTKKGLAQLAQAWRSTFSIPLVLVTGSNGKTTVKEMIASIFSAAVGNHQVLVTQGNLNNDIGLPLTLLGLRPSDALAVIELGINHPGETAQLAAVAQANIVLINNAQREHQEFMASVEAVAIEHADAIHALPISGVAVFPADSKFTDLWRQAASGKKVLDFALTTELTHSQASVSGYLRSNGLLQIQTELGAIEVRLNILGNHNARNALAATAVALAAGVSLEKIKVGLETFLPVSGRMQVKSLNAICTLIDDSYNANPDSVRAAIDALSQVDKVSWLVLGDMGEVGNQGPAFHKEVGAYAAEQGISNLFVIGDQGHFTVQGFNEFKSAKKLSSNAQHFLSMDLLQTSLLDQLQHYGITESKALHVLVKGSRFMRMERVVQALQEGAKACS
jgi:UDP-N-acetylmuramoyl-tripeptide--D-alanyl-D-alanine ligase